MQRAEGRGHRERRMERGAGSREYMGEKEKKKSNANCKFQNAKCKIKTTGD
jgi:hypothetical protein